MHFLSLWPNVSSKPIKAVFTCACYWVKIFTICWYKYISHNYSYYCKNIFKVTLTITIERAYIIGAFPEGFNWAARMKLVHRRGKVQSIQRVGVTRVYVEFIFPWNKAIFCYLSLWWVFQKVLELMSFAFPINFFFAIYIYT